jgi:hypothetical protein
MDISIDRDPNMTQDHSRQKKSKSSYNQRDEIPESTMQNK